MVWPRRDSSGPLGIFSDELNVSRWKWLPVAVLGAYLLGPMPHVEWRDCPPAPTGEKLGHRHVALYLATLPVRLFDLDLTQESYLGLGLGARLWGPRLPTSTTAAIRDSPCVRAVWPSGAGEVRDAPPTGTPPAYRPPWMGR